MSWFNQSRHMPPDKFSFSFLKEYPSLSYSFLDPIFPTLKFDIFYLFILLLLFFFLFLSSPFDIISWQNKVKIENLTTGSQKSSWVFELTSHGPRTKIPQIFTQNSWRSSFFGTSLAPWYLVVPKDQGAWLTNRELQRSFNQGVIV